MLCHFTFQALIKKGYLRIIDAYGRTHEFGNIHAHPMVTIRLHDAKLHGRLFYCPQLHMGEAWMNGTLTVEDGGTLRTLLMLLAMNMGGETHRPSLMRRLHGKLGTLLSAWDQFNAIGRSKHHVAHHYDLSDALYELFLDRDMQYSCGYFTSPDDTLEDAQLAKKRHIAAKLLIEPGMRVLDIGCGWGGLALYLARKTGAHVTGLTISKQQLARARQRAQEMGLERQVEFYLRDYREEKGTYDRIVSIGMFEHLGKSHYRRFFKAIRKRLKPEGIALLDATGRMDPPGATNAWIKKYIFPGNYVAAPSEALTAIEKSGLWACDMEILRTHYALTIEQWHRRFTANRARIAEMYDERFCRMWEFYLLAAEMEFRFVSSTVFQIQLTRRVDTLPITRDYMTECEHLLEGAHKLPSPKRYAMH